MISGRLISEQHHGLLDEMAGLSYVEVASINGEVVAGGIIDIQPIEIPQIMGAGSIVFCNVFHGFF